jgi:photosystem II stability/assembly factor-like uncharacterized protein
MKKISFLLLCLFATMAYSQEKPNSFEEENEDLEYEIEHKSQPWFANMKDGANYFEVNKQFGKYFSKHKWQQSKARQLGESWLKTKIFYLDSKGNVQPEPTINISNNINEFSSLKSTSGTWTLLGPVNSATTNLSGSGNHGGYVYMNRIDPTNTQKMFVAFVTGGLWMTSNGGTSWTLVDSNLPDDTYYDVDVCISNPQIVYALSEKQVIKSIDGGLTWIATTLTSSSYPGTPYDIAVSTSNPDILTARWGDKLYRTINGGTNWSEVLNSLPNYSIWDCSIHSEMLDWSTTNANVVYHLSTSNNNQVKLYRSGNAGQSFSEIKNITLDPTVTGQTVGWAKLMLPSTNSNSIYVAIGSGDNPYGHNTVHLYKLNATTGAEELKRINMITDLHHGDITMDRKNENNIVYGAYSQTRVHFSSNNGANFADATSTTHSDIRSIDVVGGRVMTGSDGESVLSLDGGKTNTTITNSISNHELWGFGSAFKTDLVASGNNHGPVMVKEAANGFDWYNGTGADQGNTDVNPLDDRYIYSQGYSNYRYFRDRVHNLYSETNLLDIGGIYNYFNSIEFHPNKYYTMITHHAGYYPVGNPNLATWKNSLIKTDDNGASISIVKTFASQVFREKISMKNPKYMYVVEGLTNNKLWKTTDAGLTWTNVTPSNAASSGQTNISDIAVSDEKPGEVWVTYSGVQSTCKILKSTDFGVTWTNLTQPTLTDSPITKIVFQRGSNGGVYVGNKSGIYYRNNTMPNWVLLGTGLPMSDIRFMFINYNKGKLKIGTSRGAFEHNLYETSPPNALISASTTKIACPYTEKVQFKDYSVVRNATATWAWEFPGGTPATSTEENPLISYKNATDGLYNVKLTVTDALGTSTQTLTNFIEIASQCGNPTPEGIPGNVAKFSGEANNDYITVDGLNVNKNSFTFSCWIKPNGIQPEYSGICINQDGGDAFGLNFRGNNSLGIHPAYGWDSGLIAPSNQWSHVALVSNGTDMRIYLNGVEKIDNTAVASEIFNNINIARYGRNFTGGRSTTCEIDEVSIWNRPLTIDEVRKWKHLTKSTAGDPILTGLIAYYQFNESSGSTSINKTGNPNFASYVGSGYTHDKSNAPVFGGKSEKINVNTAGQKNFATAGLSMTFANGTYPNGDVWVSRGSINPDQLPDQLSKYNSYTIVNNYGTNQTFTPLSAMSFTGNSLFVNPVASNYNLYKRGSNDFGNTWGTRIDKADSVSGTGLNAVVTFSTGLNVTSFSQFVLSNDVAALAVNDYSIAKNNPSIYPNPIKSNNPLTVFIPDGWDDSTMILYDVLGKNITQTALKSGKNDVLLNLPTGIYQLIISDQNNKYSSKMIIE